jgi:hypothetical protein
MDSQCIGCVRICALVRYPDKVFEEDPCGLLGWELFGADQSEAGPEHAG